MQTRPSVYFSVIAAVSSDWLCRNSRFDEQQCTAVIPVPIAITMGSMPWIPMLMIEPPPVCTLSCQV